MITSETHSSLMELSERIPAFVFLFSPYCGHCNIIHPDIRKLMDQFEHDFYVMIGEIDCSNYRSICSSFYKTSSFPSFYNIINRNITKISTERNMKSFIDNINNLKNIKYQQYCSKFSEIKSYPAFVLDILPNISDGCSYIDNIIKKRKDISSSVYIKENSTESAISVYYSADMHVKKHCEYSTYAFLDFIQEYEYPPFSPIPITKLFSLKRQLAILIPNDIKEVSRFKDSSKINHIQYYWTYINKTQQKNLPLRIKSNTALGPSVIVTDSNKKGWAFLPHINESTDLTSIVFNETFESLEKTFNSRKEFNNITSFIAIGAIALISMLFVVLKRFHRQPKFE